MQLNQYFIKLNANNAIQKTTQNFT